MGPKLLFEQSQRQELRQTLSAQQIQYVAVLQMTVLELQSYLTELQLENPVLEVEPPELEAVTVDNVELMRWLVSHPVDRKEDDPGDEDAPFERMCPDENRGDLQEYLHCQFDLSLGERDLTLLRQLACSLDEAGYLRLDAKRLGRMGYTEEEINEAIAYLQSLDPPGIGAANLQECLMIQLRRKEFDCPEVLELVCNHLEDLAQGKFNKTASAVHITTERARELYRIIRTLDPRPGSAFGGDTVRTIIPDIMVTEQDGKAVCVPNRRYQPRVNINRGYLELAEQDDKARAYVNQKIAQAMWVTRLIAGRQTTIERIADFVVERQREFFENPEGTLGPLRLREAAEQLGIHESTVSRAVNGKYLQCKRGVFSLKYFFCGSTAADGAPDAMGSQSVKERIRELIDAEDKKNPLSDAGVSSLLAVEGIALARRTVAKYRDELMLPAAALRKA